MPHQARDEATWGKPTSHQETKPSRRIKGGSTRRSKQLRDSNTPVRPLGNEPLRYSDLYLTFYNDGVYMCQN